MKIKKMLCGLIAIIMTICACSFNVVPTFASETTIYVLGDSLACNYEYDEKYALPRGGWGMYLDRYLTDDVNVVNLAISGRSSKSFTTEENYKTLINNVKKGDYVLIAFGQNDARGAFDEDPSKRYTEPNKAITDENSFKYYMYNYYIKPVQDKGANPVLITTLIDKDTSDGTPETEMFIPYSNDIIDLANEYNLNYIKMSDVAKHMFSQEEKIIENLAIFIDSSKGIQGYDMHFNRYGANIAASDIAAAMKSLDNLNQYVDLSYLDNDEFTHMTRGEFVAEVVRLLGKTGTDGSSFSDVPADYEYAKEIKTAKEIGIIKGNNNEEFNPNEYIKTEDVFVILDRLSSNSKNLNTDTKALVQYTNLSNSDNYAKSSIVKILNSLGDGRQFIENDIDFKENASRENCFLAYSLIYYNLNNNTK